MVKNNLVSAVVGFVFALGLGIAGMTQPQKVIGFLDVFGTWDPTLLFVMVGAIGVHLIVYRWLRKQPRPKLDPAWHLPTAREVTPSLVIGSAIFGMGWGLAGYCPGPGWVSLATSDLQPILFVFGMLFGMLAFKFLDRKIGFKR